MPSLNPTRAHLLEIFALDMPMVRGSGARLFDENGNEYLDFLSQYGALPFGHNPERGWAALRDAHQAAGRHRERQGAQPALEHGEKHDEGTFVAREPGGCRHGGFAVLAWWPW